MNIFCILIKNKNEKKDVIEIFFLSKIYYFIQYLFYISTFPMCSHKILILRKLIKK